MRTERYTVFLTGEEAAAFTHLAPGECVPDEIVASIGCTPAYSGALRGTLAVYWYGNRKDSTRNHRRTSAHYTLTRESARGFFGSMVPKAVLDRLPLQAQSSNAE